MKDSRITRLLDELEASGARMEISVRGEWERRIGRSPSRVTVRILSDAAVAALSGRDPLGLAEAYLDGGIEIEGDARDAFRVTDHLSMRASGRDRVVLAIRSMLGPRSAWRRRGIAAHYDRPFAFFAPWLGKTRSYTHGLYDDGDGLDASQRRKLETALTALQVRPGDHVLDVGAGWGAFLEFAGKRNIGVCGISLSLTQCRYVTELIDSLALPCTMEHADFWRYDPGTLLDAVVFMGSLEHLLDLRGVARFAASCVRPGGRIYADFCAQRLDTAAGAFLSKHVWPGPARYVRLDRWLSALEGAGLRIVSVDDDTESYGRTVADWANRLDVASPSLARSFGQESVRTFRLLLRGSQYFFETGRTQAYRVVAER